MNEVLTAIGLVLVIEGALWALSPQLAIRMLAAAAATPMDALRMLGVAVAAVGFAIVWSFRGG